MNGRKLPPLAILKEPGGGKVGKLLAGLVSAGIIACVQEKGWMVNDTMCMWYNKMYNPYVSGVDGISGLLWDDSQCHKNGDLQDFSDRDRTMRFMIPPHYA